MEALARTDYKAAADTDCSRPGPHTAVLAGEAAVVHSLDMADTRALGPTAPDKRTDYRRDKRLDKLDTDLPR